jgi:Trk K+ transport system NAD-binding subunit
VRGAGDAMMEEKRKILLFGLGYFEQQLLKAVSQQWATIAIDMNEEKINSLRNELPEVEFHVGDASSILTWKKLNVKEIIHVITTMHDMDVNVETCRIVRDVLKLEVPITIVSYKREEEPRLEQFNVTIVNPIQIGLGFILNRLEKNYIKAVDIGLKKGEIIEVPILAKSHLVDRTLSVLRPTKWHIAAIYRDGNMIIPTGENHIRVKDRVVLMGDPKVLENVATILLKGDPQFPLQFGNAIGFPIKESFAQNMEELQYIKNHLKAKKIVGYPDRRSGREEPLPQGILDEIKAETGRSIRSEIELIAMEDDMGMIFLPYSGRSRWGKAILKNFFKKALRPFLLSRLKFPYDGIIASLNCPDPAFALELGIDLSRLFHVPFQSLYSTMPQELRTDADEELLKKRYELVADFESIHKKTISFTVREGNPVKETLAFVKEYPNNLLVLLYNRKDRFSFFAPHVQYHIAKKSSQSTLLIPVEAVYES